MNERCAALCPTHTITRSCFVAIVVPVSVTVAIAVVLCCFFFFIHLNCIKKKEEKKKQKQNLKNTAHFYSLLLQYTQLFAGYIFIFL